MPIFFELLRFFKVNRVMNIPYCSNCGEEVSEDVEFCPNCRDKASSTESTSSSDSKAMYAMIVVVIVAIVVSLSVGLIFLTGGDKSFDTPEDTVRTAFDGINDRDADLVYQCLSSEQKSQVSKSDLKDGLDMMD